MGVIRCSFAPAGVPLASIVESWRQELLLDPSGSWLVRPNAKSCSCYLFFYCTLALGMSCDNEDVVKASFAKKRWSLGGGQIYASSLQPNVQILLCVSLYIQLL